jgi:hypothetical protein
MIDDTRSIESFKKETFSGYKKTDVYKALFKSIDSKKYEESSNWLVECIISGYTCQIWEKLCLYASKFIHINNTNLPIYIYKKNILFQNIVNSYKCNINKENILLLRNNETIKNLMASLLYLLITSEKIKIFKQVKLSNLDFSMQNVDKRLKSTHNILPESFIHMNEPDELRMIMNEIYFNLQNNTYGYDHVIYWIDWLLKWEKMNKNMTWNIDDRNVSVDKKYRSDIIWILWNIIHIEKNKRDKIIINNINSLYQLYIHSYSKSKKNLRLPYIYNSIALLTYDIKNKPILKDIIGYIQIQINIDKIFKVKNIKSVKNEKVDNIDINKIINDEKDKERKKKKVRPELEKINNNINIFNELNSNLYNINI